MASDSGTPCRKDAEWPHQKVPNRCGSVRPYVSTLHFRLAIISVVFLPPESPMASEAPALRLSSPVFSSGGSPPASEALAARAMPLSLSPAEIPGVLQGGKGATPGQK